MCFISTYKPSGLVQMCVFIYTNALTFTKKHGRIWVNGSPKLIKMHNVTFGHIMHFNLFMRSIYPHPSITSKTKAHGYLTGRNSSLKTGHHALISTTKSQWVEVRRTCNSYKWDGLDFRAQRRGLDSLRDNISRPRRHISKYVWRQ